jgi:small subunit ribosomal protein S4
MARYRGSRIKVIRRLGTLPGFTTKFNKKLITDNNKQLSQYGIHLKEKQKLRYNYGICEHELIKYVRRAKKRKGNTGNVLLQLLEMRLDNILFRAGLVPTISTARQLIGHGHIKVNNKKVTIPGFNCKISDEIEIKKSLVLDKVYDNISENSSHLSMNQSNKIMNITIINDPLVNSLGFSVNILLVLEYYSGK